MKIRHWMICYDIRSARRIQKVCRFLKDHALHVQKSVFYCQATRDDMAHMTAELADLINPKEDDVRIYAAIPLDRAERFGVRMDPEDLLFE